MSFSLLIDFTDDFAALSAAKERFSMHAESFMKQFVVPALFVRGPVWRGVLACAVGLMLMVPSIGVGAAHTPMTASASAKKKATPVVEASSDDEDGERSVEASRVFATIQNSIIYIETQTLKSGSRSSSGTGWLVAAPKAVNNAGLTLAVTNYHVVASAVLEPQRYRLEYKTAKKAGADDKGKPLKVIAVDVVHDLAVVMLDQAVPNALALQLDARVSADASTVPKGERLFSLGYPLDLGITIVEGTYNGFTEGSRNAQMHFSGAINSGMSGGPTVTQGLHVTGVNVAKLWGGDLVSFLVPATFVRALLDDAILRIASAKDKANVSAPTRADITKQLDTYQREWTRTLIASSDSVASSGKSAQPFGRWNVGQYSLPDKPADWMRCGGDAEDAAEREVQHKSEVRVCRARTQIYVDDNVSLGQIVMRHRWFDRGELGHLAFFSKYRQQFSRESSSYSSADLSHARCTEKFVNQRRSITDKPLELRAVLCVQAYKKLPGLYTMSLQTATLDSLKQGVQSSLMVDAVGYEQGLAVVQAFMGAIRWK
jgi:serine protease Do